MTNTVSYELGASYIVPNKTGKFIFVKPKTAIEGVKVWVRNEKNGEYVQIFEVGPTAWVDNEPQAWSRGNFEDSDTAIRFAVKAYRWINDRKGA